MQGRSMMASNRGGPRMPPPPVGQSQTVTIPVSLRVESYQGSGPSAGAARDEELREMRGALHGVREELRQLKLTVAELVRISYENAARLESLMTPPRMGPHIMEPMHRPSDHPHGAPQMRDAGVPSHRPARGGSAVRGRWPQQPQQQHNTTSQRPAAPLAKPPKKKPVPSAEVLSDLSSKQDEDPMVSLVKKAVSGGQELTRQEREGWPKESQVLMRQWAKLEVWNGVLYRRACINNGAPPVRQVVASSQSLRPHILAAHRRMGHCPAERLLEWARGQIFSPGMAAQVDELIKQCEKCGGAKKADQTAATTPTITPTTTPKPGESSQEPPGETASGKVERPGSSGSPEVYALAPDQDPEQDPENILSEHSDSRGSSPCEGRELSPVEKVPASSSSDQGQESSSRSSSPPSPSPPPEGDNPGPSPMGAADSFLNKTDPSHPAGRCGHHESLACSFPAGEGAAMMPGHPAGH